MLSDCYILDNNLKKHFRFEKLSEIDPESGGTFNFISFIYKRKHRGVPKRNKTTFLSKKLDVKRKFER